MRERRGGERRSKRVREKEAEFRGYSTMSDSSSPLATMIPFAVAAVAVGVAVWFLQRPRSPASASGRKVMDWEKMAFQ